MLLLQLTLASLLVACGGGGDMSMPQQCSGGDPAVQNSAVLEWDAVTGANVSGYRVYYGNSPKAYFQSKGQGEPVVGGATTFTVTGLMSGTTYYFAVTAYDQSEPLAESDFSNEVCKSIS